MKSKLLRNILISFGILCVLAAIAAFFISSYINNSKDYKKVLSVQDKVSGGEDPQFTITEEVYKKTAEDPEIKEEKPDFAIKSDIINLLFLGIDRTEYRDKTMEVYRTDTIIIASIDLNTKRTNVISIPRDTYVYIPAIDRKDKINHAYVWGGMKENGIKSTIEAVTGFIKYAEIDYYFALDMEPIIDLVDAFGGVEVDVEIEMKNHGADLDKGLQVLNGEQAFDYIHWRYSGNGDIDRVKRQQKFIKAFITKLTKSGNIIDAVNIALRYNKYIQTNLSTPQIIALAELYRDIQKEGITFYDIPGHGEYIDNISYWIPDEEETQNNLKKVFNK